MSLRSPRSAFDPWDRFWSEAMVWSLRLASYASNHWFFTAARASLETALAPAAVSALLLAYSVTAFWAIERFLAHRHDPAYAHLDLTPEQRRYRVGREQLLIACMVFTASNLALSFLAAFALSAPVRSLDPAANGLAGIIATIFAVFIGIIFLTGRGQESGRRQPLLFPLGIAAFLVPVAFLLLTLKAELFPGPTATW